MALTDPQVIAVNGVNKSMPLISRGASTLYKMFDDAFRLTIKHVPFTEKDKKPRVRHTITFEQRKLVTDPITSTVDWDSVRVSVQIDRPQVGFTDAEISHMETGLAAWLDAAMVTKIFGGES